MENSETFDFAPLFAAALAWLRDWLSGAGERAAWRDRNSAPEGVQDAKPAREANWRAYASSPPPGA
jgi:hypothetical protein